MRKMFRDCGRKGDFKLDRMIWGRLMSHIYEKPLEKERGLIDRILSVCVYSQKHARYIRTSTQRTLCVTSSITMRSQAVSSKALVNYSKILPLKYTTDNFEKYIYNDKKKFKLFYRLIYFRYLMLRNL
jgi:hypothetical protein